MSKVKSHYWHYLLVGLIVTMCGCGSSESENNNNTANNDFLHGLPEEELRKTKYLDKYPSRIDTFLRNDLNKEYSKDSVQRVQILPFHATAYKKTLKDGKIVGTDTYLNTSEINVQVDLKFNNSYEQSWLYVFDENGEFKWKAKFP